MTPTRVELHATLYFDCDRQHLTEEDVERLRLSLAETFREEFDRMTTVAGRLANCTDCSVGVSVL